MKKFIKTLCIVIVALIVAVSAATILFTGVAIDAINTEINATPVPATVYQLNEEAHLPSQKVIIGTPVPAVINAYMHVPEGIEVIEIPLTVYNSDDNETYVAASSFKLYKNNVLCEDYIYGENWFMGQTVGGGRVFQGYLYYQVPVSTGDSVLELEYTYDYHGSKVIFKIN
jgi:hypothetical protein